MSGKDSLFIKTLKGEKHARIPFWFMRQAGRYLPEYMALRKEAGSFLDLCFNSDFAAEVTIQPIDRFDMDAAILFSDILVIPLAMGQDLAFVQGEGPKLPPLQNEADIENLITDAVDEKLDAVYHTVSKTRARLSDDKALIGFAGAPWTVATYMIEGGSSRDYQKTKKWAMQNPQSFGLLMDKLVEATSTYLIGQIKAGVNAIQLFDSWSGVLTPSEFEKWVIAPAQKIVQNIREFAPDFPVIGFPKGAGVMTLPYLQTTGIDGIGIDAQTPTKWVAENLQPHGCVQGNLDPLALLCGGDVMMDQTKKIIADLENGPFIFNLGHGIIKETSPEHVAMLSDYLKNYKRDV